MKNPENSVKLSSVSFFCPAYNEEKNIPALISRVYPFLKEITDVFEIIIIDNGSLDNTGNVADNLSKKFLNIRVIHHIKNLGYGGALYEGFREAKYDYVMYTDGDNQYDVYELKPYLNLLSNHDILSGYVIKKALTLPRTIQSSVFNFLVRMLFSLPLEDINCSLKIYKRKVIESMQIKSRSAFIDAEMLVRATRAGNSITQFPVTHFPRMNGVASGSKWTIIYGTIKDMIKFKLNLL
jgi:glycosyltransferase involved in cell wall biosynthesis